MSWKTQQTSTPVADVFRTISRELTDVSKLLGDMHAPVEPETWRQLARDKAWVNALQNIDRIEQTLNAISRFLSTASQQCDETWEIDPSIAANEITLAQLRDRLHPMASGLASVHQSGDCELF